MPPMVSESELKSLHPLEVKTLLAFPEGEVFDATTMAQKLTLKIGQCNQAVSWLSAKEYLAEERRETHVYYERTPLGEEYLERGTPAQRMIAAVSDGTGLTIPELAQKTGLPGKEIGSGFGRLSKMKILAMDGEKRVMLAPAGGSAGVSHPDPDATICDLLRKASDSPLLEADLTVDEVSAIQGVSKKRGAADSMFRIVERERVYYRVNESGAVLREALVSAGITGEETGRLTPEHLQNGSWRTTEFRPYGLNAPSSRLLVGRRNPYCEYLDSAKDKLTSLGFEEFDGPLVETEFWNSDALFMPQFHSARDIHDVYYVKEPDHAREIEEPYLSQVAATHEDGWKTGSRGWGYGFDRDFTRRLILRSQGTVMSAKTLHTAKIPGKYFGVLRCFRYDQVDATHLSDFYQTEGIVLGDEVNLRNLLGLLKMFAEELAGATEVRYVPGYFPFTEPSVEVHIKHPVLGWFELGGSGIFRPEVTKPMGIDVPVLAWGLGIDRMALMHLGLNDLRELFSTDLESVRLRRREG